MMMLHKVTFILLVIGGLNWLLEAFGYGVGHFVPSTVAMVVYVLVGLSAIYELAMHGKMCKECGGMGMGMKQ